jgi:hypothetical protein
MRTTARHGDYENDLYFAALASKFRKDWQDNGAQVNELRFFSSRRTEIGETMKISGTGEPIKSVSHASSARRSPRAKLASVIFGLSPRFRQQSGLEFKLAIYPYGIPNARDSEGNYLSPDDFPRHETAWIDGNLLVDDE